MSLSERPDPDALLRHVQVEEERRTRGRLKIFLGYVAGVGKTFAMLDAAHLRLAEGKDVVVGYVETHGRTETEALVAGLELIPRRQVAYRGTTMPEMDVDTILARRPQLALVDELAHSNAPGSCHAKRYQDVTDLLDAGIDIYTTLNIQHLESLSDVVTQITGIQVRETVPDHILDEADEIELIDLPPDELLHRLREGKVYVPEQAGRAIEKFFRPGNLTALREMALRRAAARVDGQMRAYMQTRAIAGPWAAGERLLVAIGPSPLSERLVRAARRLATSLDAEWVALYVETPDHSRLPQAARDRVRQVLHLAEELGATIVTLPGATIAETMIRYARQHNVTKIVAGKPLRSRWHEWLHGSVIDQIIRSSGDIDVYVISGGPGTGPREALLAWTIPHSPPRTYLASTALVALMTLVGQGISPFLDPTNLVMPYLLAVVIAATSLGRGPAILASALGVLAFNFFFVPPRLTLAVAHYQYLLTFLALFIVGIVISNLAARSREQAQAAQQREAQTAVLYALSRELATAAGVNEILHVVLAQMEQTFGREVLLLLPDAATGNLHIRASSSGLTVEEEFAVADWAFRHGQAAGWGTGTLAAAKARYLPLKTARGVVGVVGVRPADPAGTLSREQRRLLEAFASQSALAIERAHLAQTAQHTHLLQEREKLQTALLNSISHDLRTPLASITGSLSTLRDEVTPLEPTIRRSLTENAWEEAERLNRLVGNLLDMTRMEAGALRLLREPYDLQEVVAIALAQMKERLNGHPLTVEIPDTLPLVWVDGRLLAQVLVNLLDNALKYSPPTSPVSIHARQVEAQVEVVVADRGVGIPDETLPHIFDKFYRVPQGNGAAGTGLGLSISRGIVEAHGGTIHAEARLGGGSCLIVTLPLAEGEGVGGGVR